MSRPRVLARVLRWPSALALGLALLSTNACQRARSYDPGATSRSSADRKDPSQARKPEEPSLDLVWDRQERVLRTDVPIELVTVRSNAAEWHKLPGFWNEVRGKSIKLKVPLGLLDPTDSIPSASPLTKLRWALGRRLFFDDTWLTADGGQSCASCHVPSKAFTDGLRTSAGSAFNTPTLINAIYNTHQFWDGRAASLEEVVQRAPEDERESEHPGPFKHTWSGVIKQLRASASYTEEFAGAFNTPPTQGAVGKALATYMRTLLAGNSINDRALHKRHEAKIAQLTVDHYKAVLGPDELRFLGRGTLRPDAVAAELLQGYTLFHGKAGCAACHDRGNGHYSDGEFHNIGVDVGAIVRTHMPVGRAAAAPLGLKRTLVGAYKTPTLRALLRTGPYFHNGERDDLTAVVRWHVTPAPRGSSYNEFLDPRLSVPNEPEGTHKDFRLSDADIAALVLFLRALNGEDVDAFVAAPLKARK